MALQEGKYYVGISSDVEARIAAHRAGQGSAWTVRYPVLEVLRQVPNKSFLEEDLEVKSLMLQYGVDNVRGGSYSAIVLPAGDRRTLERELRSAQNLCWACGEAGHYASRCPQAGKGPKVCARCGWPGHAAETCFAQTSRDGQPLPPRVCGRCGRGGHRAEECQAKKHKDGSILLLMCQRCGRGGHLKGSCYARTLANGEPIASEARGELQGGATAETPTPMQLTPADAVLPERKDQESEGHPNAPLPSDCLLA